MPIAGVDAFADVCLIFSGSSAFETAGAATVTSLGMSVVTSAALACVSAVSFSPGIFGVAFLAAVNGDVLRSLLN